MGAMMIKYPPCNCCGYPPFVPPEIDVPPLDDLLRDNPVPGFPRHGWNADLFGMVFLAEFSQQNWQNVIQIAAPANDAPNVQRELTQLLELVPLRQARMPEIRSQDHDFILPFLAHLTMTEDSHPTTYEVIKAACRIGEMLMAFYKAEFNRPRPTQFHPGLLSELLPVHPSYPSGHALVARLIARCLGEVVESDLQRNWLLQMATRIAENREIAGLHFRSDSDAGRSIADQAFERILLPNCPRFRTLLGEARAERQALRPGRILP